MEGVAVLLVGGEHPGILQGLIEILALARRLGQQGQRIPGHSSLVRLDLERPVGLGARIVGQREDNRASRWSA